jgi:hypothetical protein
LNCTKNERKRIENYIAILSLFCYNRNKEKIFMGEKKNFRYFGAMLDCSRNAVMKVSEVKRFIDCLQIMGYNALELYTEDTYEIEGEPRFGYLRGRYSKEELKELDAYAKIKGIELIPCVQTLGHFTALVKNGEFDEIVDLADVLLADEEKTYALIEKIFQTLSECFTSRLVNIGMDETFMLGRGKFLERKGFEPRVSIFLRHLQRVAEIAKRYGFAPHMWSDMFFRSVLNGKYYAKEIVQFPKEILQEIPENIELAYWDYDHYEKEEYDYNFASHANLNRRVWFAGGTWTWTGFAPLTSRALARTKAAMASVVENGIEDVLITSWGDDGSECSYFSVLPVLYSARRYADGVTDDDQIKREFYELFKVEFDDFMLLELPDDKVGLSKTYLYNDLFLGVFDKEAEKKKELPYAQAAKALTAAAKRNSEYAYLFESQARLCEAVAVKWRLGIEIRKAYQEKDRKALKSCVKNLACLEKKIVAFHQALYRLWHRENKPQGWEIQDARLGGLLQRVRTCKMRLNAYLSHRLTVIEELEEEILEYADSIRYAYLISRNLS